MAAGTLYSATFGIGSRNNSAFFLAQYVPVTADTVLADLPDAFPTDISIGLDAAATGSKFWYPTKAGATDSVQPGSQFMPWRPNDILNQQAFELGGGKISIYNTTNSNRFLYVSLKDFTTTKRQRLYKFFRNIVVGKLKTFQYEDEGGNIYTVRYWNGDIDMPMEYWLLHTAVIELRKEVT